LYCERRVEERIRHAFDYAFHAIEQTHVGAVPQLEIRPIGLEPIEILGQSIQPVRLFHGPRFEVLGFRIGNVAYCTDTNGLPNKTIDLLQGLDVLVLDALRTDPHPTHFSIDEAMAMADKLGAKQTYFTHVSHEFDFESTNRRLPANRQLAFDGQRIQLT
jgi:phosphoribosyl 1,2-cyclic phosphate phosphodiesterase